ncbi:MAG: hypothetical protein ACOY93_00865 [Bacillota bacterium]
MPSIVWWIVGVVFVAPVLILVGLFLANRFGKGNPARAVNALWLVLLVMLTLFLAFAFFQGAE